MVEVGASNGGDDDDDDDEDEASGPSVCIELSSPEDACTDQGNLSWRWWECRCKLWEMGWKGKNEEEVGATREDAITRRTHRQIRDQGRSRWAQRISYQTLQFCNKD